MALIYTDTRNERSFLLDISVHEVNSPEELIVEHFRVYKINSHMRGERARMSSEFEVACYGRVGRMLSG